LSFYLFLVNPTASSHFQNAPQQNLTQNYSLHPNPMQATSHFNDASFNSTNNNFNNFDQSPNQFYQSPNNYPQQSSDVAASSSSTSTQQYQVSGQMTQQQNMYQQQQQQQGLQYYGQSIPQQQQQHQGINTNGPTSTYQHTINDLLVHQPSNSSYQTNMYNNQQEHIQQPTPQTHQSVSILHSLLLSMFD
jgi:hypothetical protein